MASTPSPKPATPTDNAWVALAVFAQPHGVSGRVKVKSLANGPDDFAKHAALTDERGNPVKLKITGHTQGMAVVEVEGVTTRDAAELLRGKKIGAARAAMPELTNPNRFYVHDLIGLNVFDDAGNAFGMVDNVVNYGASDILEITRPDGKSEMYAFTHINFPTIDLNARKIVINQPEIME